jgi:hypothetical protein
MDQEPAISDATIHALDTDRSLGLCYRIRPQAQEGQMRICLRLREFIAATLDKAMGPSARNGMSRDDPRAKAIRAARARPSAERLLSPEIADEKCST